MSDDIKIGDVCEIVDGCCHDFRLTSLGREVLLLCESTALCNHRCYYCREVVPGPIFSVESDGPVGKIYADIPRKFLRKKPPKSDDLAEPRTEFLPAEPEFTEDLRRRLHKETA